ncbi:MAG: aminoglycoside phosphotransferase family protein [Eubacteriales bacterium]|nr:aminoglycoside phosphotransferase family protein [Eubacteriales bacterium]
MKSVNSEELINIIKRFDLPDDIYSVSCPEGGHINNTFKLSFPEGNYILQRINTEVFKRPVELTANIVKVTDHLRKVISENGGNPGRETLTPVLTKDNKAYTVDDDGCYWRCFLFIDDTVCYLEKVEPAFFKKCGLAFGRFQSQLSDLSADEIYETIPDFHNTYKRMLQFNASVERDAAGRADEIREEIEALMSRSFYADLYKKLTDNNEIPVRITHNDAKLSNILFDKETNEPLCIIDFDTIMPGLSIYDFGDSIRTGACSSLEDEPDTDKVHFLPEQYKAYEEGFIEGSAGRLTAREHELLPYGAMMITYEQALRFLADYLDGDVYYHIDRPSHNLDRTRVQIKLLSEMEDYFGVSVNK